MSPKHCCRLQLLLRQLISVGIGGVSNPGQVALLGVLNGPVWCVQFAFARNLVVKTFYPVHSFLKPAAFDCGTLEPRVGISTSELLARTSPSLSGVEKGVINADIFAASKGQPHPAKVSCSV